MSFVNPTSTEELDESRRRIREREFELAQKKEGVARVMENRGHWSVWLSPDATVLELAALMAGLRNGGVNVAAEHMGSGAFALIPIDDKTPPPTGDWIIAILSEQPRPLPTLVSRSTVHEDKERAAIAGPAKLSGTQFHWLRWFISNGGDGRLHGEQVIAINGEESTAASCVCFLHLIAKGAVQFKLGRLLVTEYGRRLAAP